MDAGAFDVLATASTKAPVCGSENGGRVNYPNNMEICNGELVTTVNDGGDVTSLAMYPRQPFNFAGRTGTIVFDVSNDSGGTHTAWPELWVSDQPVPDPFLHEASWHSTPRNGFGIRFAGCTDTTGAEATCAGGDGYLGVDSAAVITNYRVDDSFEGGRISVIGYGAVAKSGPGQLNHYAIRVSQSQIDVYGTNPFRGEWHPGRDPLVHLATIDDFGQLNFTQGLVWLEDAHYNGDKLNCPPTCQRDHSFHWDDLGFNGPVEPRDLGFDVANNKARTTAIGTGARALDDAYTVPANGSINLTIPDVSGISKATGALLVFNFYSQAVIPLHVSLNGHDLSEPWPFPDHKTFSPRTIAIPVSSLRDVVRGNNTLTFSAGNYLFQVANIDLILEGAGGIPGK
jgi:hypothetical protein